MVNHFKNNFLPLTFLLFTSLTASSQNYQAVHGSSFAGSLGTGNNPASIVNTPYPWDLTLFSNQLKYRTNAVTIYKYSLLSPATNSEYAFNNGKYNRYAEFSYNTNMLNSRIAIGRKQSVAFGFNLRGYGNVRTSSYNYIDTVKKVSDVLKLNQDATEYEVKLLQSSWVEIFATYSRTIWDVETDRLNAGITVKAMRGIAGAHAAMKEVRLEKQLTGNLPAYKLVSGNAAFGYSSNYDGWKGSKSTNQNIMDFLTHSEGGLSVDVGIEYILKSQEVTSFHDDENYYDYEWKVGLSLLDLGQNNFKYGVNSRSFNSVKSTVDEQTLQKKFSHVKSIKGFSDSLSSIVNSVSNLRGIYTVLNPARMVLNIDRNFSNHLFVNTELSLNLSPLAGDKRMYVRELNLLTITPRWETRRWGGYLPISYNHHGKLWIGGAFKAGPFLLGLHNWGNVFSSRKMANGGGYLAVTIRPGSITANAKDKRFECPPM